jgi:hypothetical protein
MNLLSFRYFCNTDIFCTEYSAHVSIFHMRCIGCGLSLPLKQKCYLGCQPSKHLSHMPNSYTAKPFPWGNPYSWTSKIRTWPFTSIHAIATPLKQFI